MAGKRNDSEKQETMLHRLGDPEYGVNPFMAEMYFKISFMTWLNIARKSLVEKCHKKQMEEW